MIVTPTNPLLPAMGVGIHEELMASTSKSSPGLSQDPARWVEEIKEGAEEEKSDLEEKSTVEVIEEVMPAPWSLAQSRRG